MHDHHPLGNLRERQGPIDGRIAAAGDDDAAPAEILAPPHEVEDALLLERLDAGEWWAVRPERAGAGRDHHRAGGDAQPGRVLDDKAFRRRGEPGDGLAEMEPRREWRRLLDQALDQFAGIDSRI